MGDQWDVDVGKVQATVPTIIIKNQYYLNPSRIQQSSSLTGNKYKQQQLPFQVEIL